MSPGVHGDVVRFIADAPYAIAMFDREMRYVAVSARWRVDYRLGDAPLEGRCHYDVFPEIPEHWRSIHRRSLAGETLRMEEEAFPRADGLTDWLRWEVQPWRDASGAIGGITIFTEDISARMNAERALRESEERFREMAGAVHEVFWLTDAEKSSILYISPGYEAIWGRSCADLLADPTAWAESIEPADRERVWLAATTKQAAGTYDEEYRIRRPDGSIRWIHDRAFPIRDANGKVYRVAGIADDVTERRALAERLGQAHKMEAVGQLAGGVAHDFNNVLSVIGGNARLAREAWAAGERALDLLDEVINASDRAAQLTRQLLVFSRRTPAHMVDLDLNDAVLRATELLRRLIPANVTLALRLAGELPRVRADESMIEQIVLNLAINARDAMPDGGRLVLATEAAKDAVVLVAEDSGSGIAPEHRDRIFEPFFTTKAVGAGTGLGLATVSAAVDHHGGRIDIETEVGKGTAFRITFPAVAEPDADPPPASARTSPPARLSGTVLVVEDEPALRRLARRVLEEAGCSVHAAADAAEALRLWGELAGRVDLVLTDMIMPGAMTGRALAERLRAERADLAVVFTSGYAPESVAPSFALVEGRNFLSKPYDPARLLAIVGKALAAKAAD